MDGKQPRVARRVSPDARLSGCRGPRTVRRIDPNFRHHHHHLGPRGLRTVEIGEILVSMLFMTPFHCFKRSACADFRCHFFAPGRACPAPFRFFSVFSLFICLPASQLPPLKSPLCAHSPNFIPNIHPDRESSIFK